MSSLSISKSVARTFEVLEYFRGTRAPSSTPALEKALNYPYSSMRVILKSLTELGYLKYDHVSRTYFPTPKLMSLGSWVESALLESTNLRRLAEAVHLRVDETTALATHNFIFNNLFRVLNGKPVMSLRVPGGIGLPLCHSVAGRVLMSQMDDAEIERIIAHTLYWVATTHSPMKLDRGEIMRSINSARATGSLVDYNGFKNGVGTIAYVVPSPFPGTPIALLVSGPELRVRNSEPKIRRNIEMSLSAYRPEGVAPQASAQKSFSASALR
jgi:DNA-binding IclR family transcriptional regulator